MADQIRINYGSLSRPKIDEIVARAIEEDRPVVLEKPPKIPADDVGLSGGWFSAYERVGEAFSAYFERWGEAAARDFDDLREALEREDVSVIDIDRPGFHEGTGVPEVAAEYLTPWDEKFNSWDNLTIVASAGLFILSIPIQYLLGFAYRTTGRAVFADLEDALMDAIWINSTFRNYLRASRQIDRERIQATISTVRNDTGKEPIVITTPDTRL